MQYEFRRGFSNESANNIFLNNMYNSLGSKHCKTLVIFPECSKVFDLVDHNSLLEKLKLYEVRGIPWFESYLNNQLHYVENKNQTFHKSHCSWDVPQRSMLGHLLYLIYFNDFSHKNYILYVNDNSLLSNNIKSTLYMV